jgi:zinc protease
MKQTIRSKIFIALVFLSFISQPALAGDDILRATLRNGMRIVIVKNSLAPVVTTEINYLAGGNESPPGFPGMAHAQEHMMFRGSPGLSGAQLSTIIASLGGEFNAETQQTVTQYFFTVPADDLDIALNIEAVRMRGVLDTDELWNQERGAIEQEVAQDLSNPTYIFSTRLLQELYAGTPYALDALGTRESFQKTTGAMLKKFYDTWYVPNNALLVVVGDVDPPAVLKRVRELFEEIPSRPLPKRPEVNLSALKPNQIQLDTDMSYGIAVVAYRLPGSDSPDYAAGQVLGEVLDNHRSRLYDLEVQGKALFTGFEGDALPKAASGYAVAAFPSGGDGKALVAEMKRIIAGYVKDGVSPDLVEAAKRHEIADAEFQKNSVPGLASLWSMAVAVEGRTSPDDDIDAVKKVTTADVNRVAQECLLNDRAVTAVLVPKASGGPTQMKEVKGPESFKPSQVEPVEVPAWARKIVAAPSLPAQHGNPADMLLPNGIRLIVQPENVSATISMTGVVRNNAYIQEPDGKEGVARIMESLFSYGTTSLDRVAFQKALDDIGADVSAGTSFSARSLADQFDRAVALLADNLLHPAFPSEAFGIVRQQTADAVTGEKQSPSYQSRLALRSALYGEEDPMTRDASRESVLSLNVNDVRSYYNRIFRPDMTTMVVIGRVTPAQARQTIEKYFGSWKASGPKLVTDPPRADLNKPAATLVRDDSRVQDDVTLVEVIGLDRRHPDYYPLEVGNHVLSGAFYATRLYRDLREKAGLVYTVESQMEIGKTRSLFGIFYACDPSNAGKARTMVEGDLRAMQTVPVTPEELRQAKALLIRKLPLSQASTDSIAGELLQLVHDDLPLDEPRKAAERYLRITAADVREAFAKWIRPADFVQVTLGPAAR